MHIQACRNVHRRFCPLRDADVSLERGRVPPGPTGSSVDANEERLFVLCITRTRLKRELLLFSARRETFSPVLFGNARSGRRFERKASRRLRGEQLLPEVRRAERADSLNGLVRLSLTR